MARSSIRLDPVQREKFWSSRKCWSTRTLADLKRGLHVEISTYDGRSSTPSTFVPRSARRIADPDQLAEIQPTLHERIG